MLFSPNSGLLDRKAIFMLRYLIFRIRVIIYYIPMLYLVTIIIIITRKGYDESQTKIEKHSNVCGTKIERKKP